MATKGTKIPSVYKVPTKADPELKLFAESIKEAVEVRLGRRGDPRDRAITLRELIDSGMAQELLDNPFDPTAGVGGIDFTGNTKTDFTIPPTPTGFSVSAAYTSFILSWDNPQMSNFAYTEVWRSANSSIGDAIKVDSTTAFVWSEEVGYAKTYYYWVRHVSTSDIEGQYSSSGNGTTSIDIAAVMSNLTQTLADLPGYSTLTSLISSSTGTAATVIKSASAPTQRANGDALTTNDIWYDTDDGQVHTRNAANNAWVAVRDATLVNLFGATSFTGSTLSAAMASAQSDVVTLTNANTSRVSEITNLTSTVNTKAKTFVQTSAPTATAIGDIWIDSDDNNKLYRASAVGSSNWVAVRDTANDNYPRVFTQASAPTAINTGDLWFDSDDSNRQYRWDGSNWVQVRDVTSQAAIATEATTRASADSANATLITNLTAVVDVKTQTFVQDSAPTAIAVGDLWVDSNDNNKLYRASAVGASNWVAVRDTLNDNYPRVFTQTSAPTAVNTGDIWFDTNSTPANKQYRWDGSSWEAVRDFVTQANLDTEATTRADADTAEALARSTLSATVTTKTRTFVQTSAPTATAVGDLWIDSDDNNKLYRSTAANNSSWVAVRDTANDGKTTVFTQTSQPTANNTGDLWFDTDDSNKQYRWDGSNWQVIRDVLTQASVTTVQNAVANGTSAEAGYGVAVNANGAVAGMYLMAASDGTLNNNTSTSNIIFEAGQVTIRNPHGNNIVPFTVLTSTDGAGNPAGVYINQAFIKAASITSAQIGSLSADLVNAVNINAGSIDSGTLSAARISTGSITTDKLQFGNGTVVTSSGSGANAILTIANGGVIVDHIGANQLGRMASVDNLNQSYTNYTSGALASFVASSPFHYYTSTSGGGKGFGGTTTYIYMGGAAGGQISLDILGNTILETGTYVITVHMKTTGSTNSAARSAFAVNITESTSSTSVNTDTTSSYFHFATGEMTGSFGTHFAGKIRQEQVTFTAGRSYRVTAYFYGRSIGNPPSGGTPTVSSFINVMRVNKST